MWQQNKQYYTMVINTVQIFVVKMGEMLISIKVNICIYKDIHYACITYISHP